MCPICLGFELELVSIMQLDLIRIMLAYSLDKPNMLQLNTAHYETAKSNISSSSSSDNGADSIPSNIAQRLFG